MYNFPFNNWSGFLQKVSIISIHYILLCVVMIFEALPSSFQGHPLPAVELETKVHEVFTIMEKAPTKVFSFSLLSHLRIYYKDTILRGRYPMVLEDVKLSSWCKDHKQEGTAALRIYANQPTQWSATQFHGYIVSVVARLA